MAFNTIDFIATQANKTGDAVAQLGRKGIDIETFPITSNHVLEAWECRIKTSKQNIVGESLIYGNATYGIWNEQKYSAINYTTFILSSTITGILGTSFLGGQTSEYELTYVQNAHNYFPEDFWNNEFIGSDSTGSEFLDDDNGYYLLGAGSYLYTDYIAKEDKVYNSIKVTPISEYVATGTDANVDIEAKAYIDTDEYNLVLEADTSLTGNFKIDGFKIRLKNTGLLPLKINSFLISYTSGAHHRTDTTYAISAENPIYREYINTETFNDNINSNATWNTITREITF